MGVWQMTSQNTAALCQADPRFVPVVAHFGLIYRNTYDEVFYGMVSAIMSQQISDQVFKTTFASFKEQEVLHDPKAMLRYLEKGGRLPFTAAKGQAAAQVAERFVSGKWNEPLLRSMSQRSRREALLQIKGIGPWTVDIIEIFVLKNPDVLACGDLGVVRGYALLTRSSFEPAAAKNSSAAAAGSGITITAGNGAPGNGTLLSGGLRNSPVPPSWSTYFKYVRPGAGTPALSSVQRPGVVSAVAPVSAIVPGRVSAAADAAGGPCSLYAPWLYQARLREQYLAQAREQLKGAGTFASFYLWALYGLGPERALQLLQQAGRH